MRLLVLFDTTSGPLTRNALPYLILLEVLTANEVYRFHPLKLTQLWHKGLLPNLFNNTF